MIDPALVRVPESLTPYVNGFWAHLHEQGYTPISARALLWLAANMTRWLEKRGLELGELTDEQVVEFKRSRHRRTHAKYLEVKSVAAVVDTLRALGVVPHAQMPITRATRTDLLVSEYEGYLTRERGLAPRSIEHYAGFARQFVGAHQRLVWTHLGPAHVIDFVRREAARRSTLHCKRLATGLRSLFRFARARGLTGVDLGASVPAIMSVRLAGIPRALSAADADRLLAACTANDVVGRRERAILLLLVRLGLRGGEVANLRLDDIDWGAGEVVLLGKNRREGKLPLPSDVGRALVAYLRCPRPRTGHRHVFTIARAPYVPLTRAGVTAVATKALRRAGIEAGGAHVLRHTAATQMLRRGAPLSAIGDVLRHQHPDSTALYAKVDFDTLRVVVRPWPGGAR